MDVIQVPSFGWQYYVHVSMDTYSGYIYASAHAGKATKHVIAHCLVSFAAMGKPQQLKTDNGPAYTSTAFQHFCEACQIHHTTGIPFHPQGQAIVEHAHATLKMQLKN
jgi:transposase InsO family protein